MTITEFLTARIDEDEAAGCGCEPNAAGDIRCHRCGERVNVKCWNCGTPRGSGPCPTPRSARVLADIAARRAIVELAEEASGLDMQVDGEFRVGRRDMTAEPYVGDSILRQLALPYAEHPDYDEGWRQ